MGGRKKTGSEVVLHARSLSSPELLKGQKILEEVKAASACNALELPTLILYEKTGNHDLQFSKLSKSLCHLRLAV